MTKMPATAENPIVVFVHVHYPDIWREMSALLAERLTLPFHLVLTSSCPREEVESPSAPSLLSTHFLPVENRGRDILPFLHAMAHTGVDFEVGLKLHTKKSPQREDGAQWRAQILDSLLPPGRGDTAIVARMRADPRIGLVTPGEFCLSVRPWVLENEQGMRRVMAALGGELSERALDDAFFAAGSMFWFRRSALAELADRAGPALFEPEEGQFDGTSAHAIERLFPVEVRRQGHLSLAVPALMSSRPDMSLAKLLELARRHADVPSRYFPAPYVPALPPMGTPPAPHPLLKLLATSASLYRLCLPVGVRRWLRGVMRRL